MIFTVTVTREDGTVLHVARFVAPGGGTNFDEYPLVDLAPAQRITGYTLSITAIPERIAP